MTTAVAAAPPAAEPGAAQASAPARIPAAAAPVGILLAPLAVLVAVMHALVRRPSLLVAATLLIDCVPASRGDVAASVHVTPADLSALALVAVVAVRIVGGDRPLSHRAWPPFALVTLALAVATVTSADTGSSLAGFVRYVELFVLIPVAVAAALRDRRDVLLVCGTAIAVSVFEGAVGSWQFLTRNGASFAGQDVRAVGTFGALDIMGMAVVVGLGIVLALAAALARRGTARIALLGIAGVLVVPLAFSLSRGSWIATLAGVAATAVASSLRLALRGAVCLAAVAVIVFAGFGVGSGTLGERAQSIAPSAGPTDQSVSDRYGLWRAAAGMWSDHPITGVGLKNFPAFRDGYAPLSVSSGSDVGSAAGDFQREPLLSPHNMYMLILSEQGLVGFSAFGIFFGALAIAAVRRRGRYVWPATLENRILNLAAPGIVVWTLVDFLYADIGGPPTVFMASMLGLVVRRGMTDTRRASQSPSRLAAPVFRGAAPAVEPRPAAARSAATPTRPTPSRAGRSDVLARAALASAVLSALGTALGLGRDLLLAALFGATGGTDAFLVAWTVPETAAPLLIEGAMAFLMVPLFSRAMARGEPAREVVGSTLPRIGAVLAVLAGCTVLAAPAVVHVLAPGLADPELAVTATRVVSLTVLMFGLAGYVSAVLRASHVFAVPAAIYLAYNVGIIATMVLLHQRLGILSAAVGVSLGSVLMVATQLPSFVRRVGLPRLASPTRSAVTLAMAAPIAIFTLTRQAQVFIERYLGSSLTPGTISHLNYAQKVGQVPMILALVLTTVTFPVLARSMAAGDDAGARRRIEADLRTIAAVVLLAAAYLVAFAPAVVAVLFERGRFSPADTAATATLLRVYVLGLLGHGFVGVLSRPFFSGDRPTWYPTAAMAAGLGANAVLAVALVRPWGATGIVAANAAGITLTAVLLLRRLKTRVPGASLMAAAATARLAVPAAGGAAAGLLAGHVMGGGRPPLVAALAGGVVVATAFVAIAALTAPHAVREALSAVIGRGRRADG